jgi:long-subunit fatty acid transport protein
VTRRTCFAAAEGSNRPARWTIVARHMARIRTVPPTVLLVATCLLARPAAADEANRNLFPFGERAAFLGNAGITSAQGDAVFYNPANLSRVGHPNLSVSANVYAAFDFEADPLLVIEGVDQPFQASGFLSIPSSLVSTYQIGGWSLATAVLVPEALKLKNRITFDSPTLHVTLLEDTVEESLWLGAGIARALTPNLMVGVSLFGIKESISELDFVRSEIVGETSMVSEATINNDSTVYNLSAIAGVYWQAGERLGIGARLHVPPIRLAGTTDMYQAISVPGDETLTSEQEWQDVRTSAPLPWDMGLGVSFRPHRRLELVADVNLQMPASLTWLDEPSVPEDAHIVKKTELAPRFGVGAEWQVVSQWSLRLGALYNRSAMKAPDSNDDDPQEHFYGVTGGVAWQKDRTHTALGGFYLRSDADLLVDGADPPRRSDARTLLYGALLTVSYRL